MAGRTHPRRRARNAPVLVTRSAAVASAPDLSTATSAGSQITRAVLPCEIRIVDEEKREIEVCATSEAKDSYGTIFGYDASVDAFERWAGNVREMHNRVAVGRKVAIRKDDAARRIYTRIRISKGAQDTWEKVKDGTLAGASIGASDVTWQNQRIGGEDVPVATRYDLVELSLVDLPSNPDALGVTFVRDGVPDDALLADLETDTIANAAGIADDSGQPAAQQARSAAAADTSDAPAADNGASCADGVNGGANGGVDSGLSSLDSGLSSSDSSSSSSTTIAERDGSLSDEDPALLIAAAALRRGQSALAQGSGSSSPLTEPTAKAKRLAALGAPGYVGNASPPETDERAATSAAPGEGTTGYGVNEPLDIDGDHENPDDYVTIQSGPTAGAVMAPSPAESVAHMAHSHHHTGQYDDPSNHRESSPHQHLDGTSHTHDHLMDHDHGGHEGIPNGHTHPHLHVPDHGHYYRVADGSPMDARLVTGEQVRTHEYVSLAAFRAAGAVEGQALTADEYRAAVAEELRLEASMMRSGDPQTRALGPYSRNPDGPADAGTPDEAPLAPSADMGQTPEGNGGVPALNMANLEEDLRRTGQCPLCHGQVRALDRDGNPIAGADANGAIAGDTASTGTSDTSVPADGWDGRSVVAEITRAFQPQYAAIASSITDLLTRIQRIEQTPQSGGPVLHAADRGSAFGSSAAGGYAAAGQPTANSQYDALASLAGKIKDPQAQTAVAAEMIRMQQEAAGMPPGFQVMPRAGSGAGSR